MKVTVIVPSFNQGRFLDEMIRSATTQTWAQSDSTLELIIIDGGSTDETLEILEKHSSKIAYSVSERDGGQADAINKGLKKATGDVVTWFGADDFYVEGIFAAVETAWCNVPSAVYAAPVASFHSRRRQILSRPHGLALANVVQYWKKQSVWHDPGLFWSRDVIEAVGQLDPSLHYAFDYDYLVRALQQFPVVYLDQLAAGFRLHRGSKTIMQTAAMMAETAAVSQRYWTLVEDVDRKGFERSEHEARVRRGVSQLVRARRGALTLLWQAFRERPFAALVRLALLGPTVFSERLRRMLPTRYFR